MKNFLFLFGFSAFTTAISGRSHCHACFDEICYTKAQIFNQHPISGQLAIDRIENIVYFHYEDASKSDKTVGFDIDDNKFLHIPGLQFSFARTVDQHSRDVYIGGANGIYIYNPEINETVTFGVRDKTIWHMQWKDKIYYTIFLTEGLYNYEKTQSKAIQPLNGYIIDDFIIDKKENIYFMSNFTVFVLKNGDKKPSMFSDIGYGLSTDINDNAYFVQRENRGLYKIDYRRGKLREVGAFASGSPYKIIFDRYNNVVYYDSDNNALFYLTPNYAKCKVTNEGQGRKLRKKVATFLGR